MLALCSFLLEPDLLCAALLPLAHTTTVGERWSIGAMVCSLAALLVALAAFTPAK